MTTTSEFTISGISCEACLKIITKRISKLPDVTNVLVKKEGNLCITATRNVTKKEVIASLQDTEYTVL